MACSYIRYEEVYTVIGIMSSIRKKEIYSMYFSQLLSSFIEYKDKSIFIFSISDIDFLNKTVCGNLITKDGIEFKQIPIPATIFNLTFYKNRSNIKKVRRLALHADVRVVNEVNRFRQYMIMEMLTSNHQTQDLLLKYKTHMSRNIYKEDFYILSEMGNEISNSDNLSYKKKLIAFDKQNMLLHNNYPVVFTIYAQRGFEGVWKTLPGLLAPEGIDEPSTALIKKLKLAAIESAKWISCFMPSLGFSTVKFALCKDFRPYLISLNGWDSKILYENLGYEVFSNFAKNLFDYNSFLSKEQEGAIDFVD